MKEFTVLGMIEEGAICFTPICWHVEAETVADAYCQALNEIVTQEAKDASPDRDFRDDYIHINFVLEGRHQVLCFDANSCRNVKGLLDEPFDGDIGKDEPITNG